MKRLSKEEREEIDGIVSGDSCIQDECVPKGIIAKVVAHAKKKKWDVEPCLAVARKQLIQLWDAHAAEHFK